MLLIYQNKKKIKKKRKERNGEGLRVWWGKWGEGKRKNKLFLIVCWVYTIEL